MIGYTPVKRCFFMVIKEIDKSQRCLTDENGIKYVLIGSGFESDVYCNEDVATAVKVFKSPPSRLLIPILVKRLEKYRDELESNGILVPNDTAIYQGDSVGHTYKYIPHDTTLYDILNSGKGLPDISCIAYYFIILLKIKVMSDKGLIFKDDNLRNFIVDSEGKVHMIDTVGRYIGVYPDKHQYRGLIYKFANYQTANTFAYRAFCFLYFYLREINYIGTIDGIGIETAICKLFHVDYRNSSIEDITYTFACLINALPEEIKLKVNEILVANDVYLITPPADYHVNISTKR